MITLTTPPTINSILGGNAPVPYDKMVLSPFTMDPSVPSVTGSLKLTSTTVPDMQAITGVLTINLPTSVLTIQVDQLNFYRRIVLIAGQKNSVQNIINSAQNSLEAGLVSLGVVSGTQTTGA